MSKSFDPNNRLDDVKRSGNKILSNFNTNIDKAISSNNEMLDTTLDQIGIDDKGNVKEGSVTDKLMDVQKENTDFAIEQIEQKKQQAESDYTKEQAGAYADYQKQINPYGAQAEQVAASGLSNSGYADSLKTQAYVAYQNRVATNLESFRRVVQDFDNQMNQARLQNNSALAEIYANAMAQRLQYIVEFGVRGEELYIQKAQGAANIEQQNTSNYLAVYNQLMQDQQHNETLAEQRRQHEATLAENKRQFNAQMSLEERRFAAQQAQAAKRSSSGGSSGSKSSSKKSSSGKKTISKSEAKTISNAVSGKKATKKDSVSVDMQSVLNLGYGPISATTLNRLVSQGKVEEYTSNGKLKYRKVFKR